MGNLGLITGNPRDGRSRVLRIKGYILGDATTTWNICHQFYLSCSILIVNHPWIVTNTKYRPNIMWHSLLKNLGIIDLRFRNSRHLLNNFPSRFQSFTTIFHYRNIRMQNVPKVDDLKGRWDVCICKLVHKKYHQQNYHNDIKYHMTLNAIFECSYG